jgi:hypothetical protein
MVKRILFHVLLFFIVCSCDQVRKAKSLTRHYVLGIPLETTPIAEPVATQEPKDYSKEAQVIAEITPSKKIYNLMNGYLMSPEDSLKRLLLSEMQKASSIFKIEDQELISNLYKFQTLIQDGNKDALEIIFNSYYYLDGANKENAGIILATGLDFQTTKTLELLYLKKSDPYCSFAGLINKQEDDDRKLQLLQNRKTVLLEFQASATNSELLKSQSIECDKTIQLEMNKINLKRNPPQATPAATATATAEVSPDPAAN